MEKRKSSEADLKSILPDKGINHRLHGFTQMITLILMKSMDIMIFKKVHADYQIIEMRQIFSEKRKVV
ncbi:hypothetical protein IW22_12210 [Chryseobacterium sp. JM1]|nr:hypothetical protein IW22_12210 [Chryseobacterium sp. JM1]